MGAFGEKNGAWYVRTNNERLRLIVGNSDHSNADWREEVATRSTIETMELYIRTLNDILSERMFEWNQRKVKPRSDAE